MYEEVFEGMNYTNKEIAEMFDKTFEDDLSFSSNSSDMVIVKDIDIFSYCEHHMALMYDMKVTVAYLPKGQGNRFKQNCKNCRYGIKEIAVTGKNRNGHCGGYRTGYRFK